MSSDSEPQIISTSTILILSGFLVGMTVNAFAGSELSPYLIAGGLSGFIAFVVLDVTATRRVQAALKEEQEQIEERLERHTSSLSSIGFSFEPVNSNRDPEFPSLQISSEAEHSNEIATSA